VSRHLRSYPTEYREKSDDPNGSFEGYAACLNSIDEYQTIMSVGAFDRDLPFFRERGFCGGLNHRWDSPIGRPISAEVDERGLKVHCKLIDTPHAREVREMLKQKVCQSMSFGFDDLERQYLDDEKSVMSYWAGCGYEPSEQDLDRCKRGALLFTRVKIFEVSPVMVPGNQNADVTSVRADEPGETTHEEGQEPTRLAVRAGGFLTLDEHFRTVQAAVDSLSDRIEQLAALRASDGRQLPPERRAFLRNLRDRLDQALAACQPKPTAAEVAQLRRDLFLLTS
jgi:HK97 family phage prohead protease